MNNTLLSFLTILFYGIAAIWQSLSFTRQTSSRLVWLRTFGFAAVFSHGILLYHWIDLGAGQNLSFCNLLSLVTWLVATLILLAAFTKPVANLTIFIFPLALASVVLTWVFPRFEIIQTAANPKQLIHILLSTLAFSLLCIAALQAILVALQERLLRSKQAGGIIRILPPLEVMETLLFQMIILGFVLLSVVLLSSLYSFYPMMTPSLWQKIALSSVAWFVFAILLMGRWYFGWRGQQAIRWTLCGVFFVMVTYFGSISF